MDARDSFLPSCFAGSSSPPDTPPSRRRQSRSRSEPPSLRNQEVITPRFYSLAYKMLHITQHFTTAVAKVNQKCVLKTYITGCKKNHELYSNGVVLKQKGRITFTTEGTMHIITIKKVQIQDFGIFLCVCRDSNTIVVSKATLYVADETPIPRSIAVPIARDTLKVLKHLVSVTTYENRDVMLRAMFQSPLKRRYYWYKNNIPVVTDQNHTIKGLGDFTELLIASAQMSDTGVYTCIMTTPAGTLSSVCEVLILNAKHIHAVLPSLPYKKLTPEIVTVNIGEELMLMCQCYYNKSLMVRWYHENINIYRNDSRRIYEDFGDGCVGLRVKNVTIYDEGMYRLTLNNLTYSAAYVTHFIVNINASLPKMVPNNMYRQHIMKPVVARIGDECKYIAEFSIFHTRGYKVIWHVGKHEITTSNEFFKMITHANSYILIIREILPTMLGDVICELRFSSKSKHHRLLETSSSYLALSRPIYEQHKEPLNTRQDFLRTYLPTKRFLIRKANFQEMTRQNLSSDSYDYTFDINTALERIHNEILARRPFRAAEIHNPPTMYVDGSEPDNVEQYYSGRRGLVKSQSNNRFDSAQRSMSTGQNVTVARIGMMSPQQSTSRLNNSTASIEPEHTSTDQFIDASKL